MVPPARTTSSAACAAGATPVHSKTTSISSSPASTPESTLATPSEPSNASAPSAVHARHDRRRCDAIADRQAADALADVHDLADELVPHHLARLDERPVQVRVQVGTADAARAHPYDDVVGARIRVGHLLDLDRLHALVDRCFHRALLTLSRRPRATGAR